MIFSSTKSIIEFISLYFQYKWNLDRHMKNHGGNGPFKCSVCNFTADIKQSLTVHEMNHHIPPLANSMDIEKTIDDTIPPENINIFDMVSDERFFSNIFL